MTRRRRILRRWLAWVALGCGIIVFVAAGTLAIYLTRPADGPAHDLIDAVQYPLRQSEPLQYNAHRVLGALFSLCPCTVELAADQYRRASYHRPDR